MVVNWLRFILCFAAVTASAAEPLHVRIDKLIDGGQIGDLADTATDAAFVRRAYLDLTGRIPGSAETRAFIEEVEAR